MKIWTTKSGYSLIRVLSGRSNAFILTGGGKSILIDTGPKFMWKSLVRRLKQIKIKNIDYLILTHAHFDHAENANRAKEKYGARVVIHKDEASYLANGENVVPKGTNPVTKVMVNRFAEQFIFLAKYEPCECDITVDSFSDLKNFGFNGSIIHTPGHTPGSISVIIDDEVALVGDTMFGVFPWSVFPPFVNDTSLLLDSWEKLLNTKCRVFIPSHGSANTRTLVEKNYRKRIKALPQMKDDLSSRTTAELGKLFPVTIVEYDPAWEGMYKSEQQEIIMAVGAGSIVRIEHMGSTAVPGLSSKPTIDILVEIAGNTDLSRLIKNLQKLNYQYVPNPENPPPHIVFFKGYTTSGIKGQTYHVHVRYPGDWDEIVFRDYLIEHPEAACNYADLKRTLAEEYKNDREKYTEAKTEFIKNIIHLARTKNS